MAGHDRLTPEGERFFRELQKLSAKQVRVGLKRGRKGKSAMEYHPRLIW